MLNYVRDGRLGIVQMSAAHGTSDPASSSGATTIATAWVKDAEKLVLHGGCSETTHRKTIAQVVRMLPITQRS